MATRTDFVMIAQTIRTFPLTGDERENLAKAFADAMGDNTHFDGDKFVFEATRGRRAGEQPTPDLPDSYLRILPEDVVQEVTESTTLDAAGKAAVLGLDSTVMLTLLGQACDAVEARVGALVDEVLGDTVTRMTDEVEAAKHRRDRTPGAWALDDNDPNAPYGPFPDETDRPAKQVARDFLVAAGRDPELYRIVYRRG